MCQFAVGLSTAKRHALYYFRRDVKEYLLPRALVKVSRGCGGKGKVCPAQTDNELMKLVREQWHQLPAYLQRQYCDGKQVGTDVAIAALQKAEECLLQGAQAPVQAKTGDTIGECVTDGATAADRVEEGSHCRPKYKNRVKGWRAFLREHRSGLRVEVQGTHEALPYDEQEVQIRRLAKQKFDELSPTEQWRLARTDLAHPHNRGPVNEHGRFVPQPGTAQSEDGGSVQDQPLQSSPQASTHVQNVDAQETPAPQADSSRSKGRRPGSCTAATYNGKSRGGQSSAQSRLRAFLGVEGGTPEDNAKLLFDTLTPAKKQLMRQQLTVEHEQQEAREAPWTAWAGIGKALLNTLLSNKTTAAPYLSPWPARGSSKLVTAIVLQCPKMLRLTSAAKCGNA